MPCSKKVGVLVLSGIAGMLVGYPVFLFISLALLVLYGDDGQGGHPTEFLKHFIFYGVFAITTLIGLGFGFLITDKTNKSGS